MVQKAAGGLSTRNVLMCRSAVAAVSFLSAAWLVSCNTCSKTEVNFGKPLLTLSTENRKSGRKGEVTLVWKSTNSTHCSASGDWSGSKPLNGSEKAVLADERSLFTLSCYGSKGAMSRSVRFPPETSDTARKVVAVSSNYLKVEPGSDILLSWTSPRHSVCKAGGAWSGERPSSGRERIDAVGATSVFTLSCDGPDGSGSDSLEVLVEPSDGRTSGLDFPSNGETTRDVRFLFSGKNLLPMYPATYIWQVKPRRHAGYYTTFFWGPDGPFTGKSYYGCHPYPDGEPKPSSTRHKWEISILQDDFVSSVHGQSTQVKYDAWMHQALRAFDDGTHKVHEFYWDLPNMEKVIRVKAPQEYGAEPPSRPALTFGDAPWAVGAERLSGILRGMQIYSASLSPSDLLGEAHAPMATASGVKNIWYLNLNPTPQDISDHSGRGHHPNWVTRARPKLWLQDKQ